MAVLTGLMLKHTIMRGEASVCDGAAGLPRPAYQEPGSSRPATPVVLVLRAGKVIIIVSIFRSAFNSFAERAKSSITLMTPPRPVSRVITPAPNRPVHEDNWQATVGSFLRAPWRKKCRLVLFRTRSTPPKIFRTKRLIPLTFTRR